MGPQDVLVDPEYMTGFSVDVILISDYYVNQILLTFNCQYNYISGGTPVPVSYPCKGPN